MSNLRDTLDLSELDLEVARGLADGLNYRQIGRRVGRSEEAIRDRARQMRHPRGALTAAQLVAQLFRSGDLQ